MLKTSKTNSSKINLKLITESLNSQCPHDWLKTKTKTIQNNLKNLPNQRWRHSTNNLHNNLSIVTKHNCKMKLQCLLKHNNFTNKPKKQNNNKMIIIFIQLKVENIKNNYNNIEKQKTT